MHEMKEQDSKLQETLQHSSQNFLEVVIHIIVSEDWQILYPHAALNTSRPSHIDRHERLHLRQPVAEVKHHLSQWKEKSTTALSSMVHNTWALQPQPADMRTQHEQ